jgi:hypothetical protein
MSQPQSHNAAGRIGPIRKNSINIGIRTHDFSACSTTPQPTTLPRAPYVYFLPLSSKKNCDKLICQNNKSSLISMLPNSKQNAIER